MAKSKRYFHKKSRCRKQKYQYRSMKIGMWILCAAFLIVLMVHWLPDKARTFKIRIGAQRENEENSDKAPDTGSVTGGSDIRVLLMTNGYENTVHGEVKLSSKAGLELTYGEKKEEIPAGETLSVSKDDKRFEQGYLRIHAKEGPVVISSLKRGYGTPEYDGVIELRASDGGIAMINELPVESYLCKVVPSEMPASYELEALKAQAVCARSFAFRQMENYGYPEYEAHVNDSTDYQVYGNSKPQESTVKAVEETKGETVRYNGKLVTTYYYSTSCGTTTDVQAWGTKPAKANAYLKSVKVKGKDGDYEKDLPWYRWKAEVPAEEMSRALAQNTKTEIGRLKTLEVTGRGPGDVAVELKAKGDKGSVTVETENKIRTALAGNYEITRQDGSTSACAKLLPSAFFTIEKSEDTFIIEGGGFGHGIGMSQNGANEMAKQRKNYKEILKLFYQGVTIE